MNLWGFTPSILIELKRRFLPFLENVYKTNPLKGEYFLPFVVDELLQEKKAEVTVLRSYDNWYGVSTRRQRKCHGSTAEIKRRGPLSAETVGRITNERYWEIFSMSASFAMKRNPV